MSGPAGPPSLPRVGWSVFVLPGASGLGAEWPVRLTVSWATSAIERRFQGPQVQKEAGLAP